MAMTLLDVPTNSARIRSDADTAAAGAVQERITTDGRITDATRIARQCHISEGGVL